MWEYYAFDPKGEKIFFLAITNSFHPAVYFWLSKCGEDYTVQWRMGLSQREQFDNIAVPAIQKLPKPVSMKELIQTSQYKMVLEKLCPINTMVLNAQQKQLVDDLLNNLPDETIYRGGGLDGHSYDLQIYQPELKKYRSWCILPTEWNKIALVIDMLVGVANLDFQRYGVKSMTYIIREIQETEYPILNDFLYEAIFIPEGINPPPKSIIEQDALQVYVKDFGKFPDDKCLVAEVNGKIVGAVWVRIMDDYGHIDDETPSLAISLYKEYRSHGIGTEMMKQMLDWLQKCGYKKVSLSVQKQNYAVEMYLNVGFDILNENEEEYIMVCLLND